MKRKDIENRLRNEAAQFTPDPLDSIKITARSENLLPYDSEVYSQGNTAVIGRSKRKTIRLFAAFAAVVVCLVLILSFALNFDIVLPNNLTLDTAPIP